MISDALRERIRQEADFACEFCGVSEIDVGGELTIDHYQPKTKGGSDQRENLLYSCMRCNQYKWIIGRLSPKIFLYGILARNRSRSIF